MTAGVAKFKHVREDRFRYHWIILSLLMICASVDEAASIHEISVEPIRQLLGASGTGSLYFAWVVPGIAFVAAAGILFARFLIHLPSAIRNQMLLAAGIFLAGAIGVEMLGAEHFELWGRQNQTFSLYCAAEESLELLGVLVYIRAVLAYLQQSRLELTVNFADSQRLSRAA